MKTSSELFSQKYGYDIFKGNKSLDQLIGQAEIDVIGISYEENQSHIYAIDVAFHEAGLNYGSKDETVTRVIKNVYEQQCAFMDTLASAPERLFLHRRKSILR